MGDSVQHLPTRFLRNVLSSILSELGCDTASSSVLVQAGVDGTQENFISVAYRVLVQINSTKTLALFFKCLVDGFTRGKVFNASQFFKNESNFYSFVLPALLKFQAERMTRVTTPFTGAPKCYKCASDDQNDVIVMEDLGARGYVMLNRLQGMDAAELHAMIEELGRFHALSLAMKDQDPEGFYKARRAIREERFVDLEESVFGRLFKVAGEDALRLIKERYPPDSPYVTKTQRFVDELLERMKMLTTPDDDEPHNVVNHGDLWINNFLFRYEDAGKVDAICFLDFQLCRYASLALDLSCALLLSMDGPTRVEHRDALLRAYHDALSTLMTQLGSDPESVIPWTALDGLVTSYAQFAVGMALLILPVQLNEGSGHDDPKAEVIAMIVAKTDRCKQRVVEVIEEAVDKGYFDQLVVPCEGENETTRL